MVTVVPQNSWWWAGGLNLAERLTGRTGLAALSPVTAGVGATEPAAARLAELRAACGPSGGAWFTDAEFAGPELIELPAETPQALAERIARPGWATFVERSLLAAPADGSGIELPSGDNPVAAFAAPLWPLVARAWERASAAVGDCLDGTLVDADALRVDFCAQLGGRLAAASARAMVHELDRARTAGRLTAATPEARFAEFIRLQAGQRELAALLAAYPVLARLLGQTAVTAADAFAERLIRLRADRAAIVTTLLGGVEPGALVSMTPSGDLHCGGRSVALLRFASGARVVYKSRPLQVHQHFSELVGWFNKRAPGLDLRAASALPRAGYGWMEYVDARPCTDPVEVDRFYWRTGALVALLYAIDGTDIHYENLIAAGDQPVLVDVETLFHSSALLPTPTIGGDPAITALTSSVLRTAVLPQMLLGEHGAVDISGIGGDDGALLPTGQVGWEAAGTDRMRLVREPARLRGAANRPRLTHREADPTEYASALLSGFRLGYDAIAAHRDELTGPSGLLARFAADQIRILARHTATYARLLDELTHPDALRDGLERDRVLDVLYTESATDPRLCHLVRYERAELWAGDTPLFTSYPASPDLWTCTGERLPGVLGTDGWAAATSKIAAMSAADRIDQEWYITAALATRGRTGGHPYGGQATAPVPGLTPDPERLLATACGLADELIGRALHGHDRANWVGLEPVEDEYWSVLPMGAGLAHGYTGVALFLAQLGALTGITRYRDLARRAIRPIPRLFDSLAADPELAGAVGTGGHLGLGGICYALARLTTLLDDSDALKWLATGVDLVGRTDDATPDIATGCAGGLAGLLAVHAELGLPAARQLADVQADRLLGLLTGGTESGFAYGSAGIGWALLRYAAVAEPDIAPRYAAAGRTELCRVSIRTTADPSWCSGVAGIAVGLAAAPAAERLLASPPLLDMSLCHGEVGVLDALSLLGVADTAEGRVAWEHRVGRLLGALDLDGPQCGTPGAVVTPGLLTGVAGIGYGLLRIAFPDRVPSVLAIESPSSRTSLTRVPLPT